jgi:hypothetical protein
VQQEREQREFGIGSAAQAEAYALSEAGQREAAKFEADVVADLHDPKTNELLAQSRAKLFGIGS